MMIVLAMENKFQLSHPSQTLESPRLRSEELRQRSCPIPAVPEVSA
jgi:hypothetical protein